MKETSKILVVGALLAVGLSGCSSKNDANEKNFSAAVAQHLSQASPLCLGLHKWPVDLATTGIVPGTEVGGGLHNQRQMNALASVGLVDQTDAQTDQLGFLDGKPTGRKINVRRYSLSANGKTFLSEIDVTEFGDGGAIKVKQSDICYGKLDLAKIVKWDGQIKFDEYHEANVVYQYKIDDQADWAGDQTVLSAFPQIAQVWGRASITSVQ